MVCLQTAEEERNWWTTHEGRSYRRRLSDAHYLSVHFYSCFKVALFRIPASKRICTNVGVFQNKARRK